MDSLAEHARPSRFADLAQGLDHPAIRRLTGAVVAGPPRALLLHGPAGCGKTSVGRLLARALACGRRRREQFDPCGGCSSCAAPASSRSWSENGVSEFDCTAWAPGELVEHIDDALRYATCFPMTSSPWRTLILDEAHRHREKLGERLLKALEDAPAKTLFLLATTEPEKLPGALIQRCVPVKIGPPAPEQCCRWLLDLLTRNHIAVAPGSVERAVALAGAVPRAALKLVESALFVNQNLITVAALEEAAADVPPPALDFQE